MSLVFVTGNAKKFAEAKMLIPELEQLDLDLPEIQSLDSREIIAAKVAAARAAHGDDLIVEDVSLELSCLDGFPGPLIKWWLRSAGPSKLWRVCNALGDVRARAVCTVGYARGTRVEFFTGAADGSIIEPREGRLFGWDSVFLPDGETRTYGEMPTPEKNAKSSRGIAMRALAEHIARQ